MCSYYYYHYYIKKQTCLVVSKISKNFEKYVIIRYVEGRSWRLDVFRIETLCNLSNYCYFILLFRLYHNKLRKTGIPWYYLYNFFHKREIWTTDKTIRDMYKNPIFIWIYFRFVFKKGKCVLYLPICISVINIQTIK